MNLGPALAVGLKAIRVNALRSALTMLGITIGVAAIIAMVAIGAGAEARLAQQIRSLGANLLVVISGALTQGGVRLAGARSTLTEDDAAAIMREVPTIQVAAPVVRGGVQVVFANSNWSTSLVGTTPDFLVAREWDVVAGRAFGPEEMRAAAKVALLGQTVAENLFGDADPIGLSVRVRNVPLEVIGVLDRKGQNTQGQDQDDTIMVPISTAKTRVLGYTAAAQRSVGAITVKVVDAARMDEAEEQMRATLRQRHNLQPGQDDDFRIRNLSEVMATQEASTRTLTLLLFAVASVSLAVGGIGIMNIMLVSVTERTREIGLRKAVGARRSDILRQFLVEAVALSLIGGLAGVVLGVGAAQAIAGLAGWPTLIRADAVLVAVLFSGAVGVFFGFYPARKAARLDPIEALRFE